MIIIDHHYHLPLVCALNSRSEILSIVIIVNSRLKLRFRHIEMYFSVSVIRGQCILGTVELPESARVCRQELTPPL